MSTKLYTVEQAAGILHVTKHTVYGLIKDKKLPTIKIGERLTRIPKKEFEEWLERQSRGGGGEGAK